MTSVEIEDVLSSIRRLVTEDLRPKPTLMDDKLILTPALRVVPDDQTDALAVHDVGVHETLDVDLDADLAAALLDAEVTEIANALEPEAKDEAEPEADTGPFPMFLHHANRVDRPEVAAAAPEAPEAEGNSVWAETVTTIGAGIPADGFESELGDVMPVPEWPESSWVAPDVIERVEEAELIAVPEDAHAMTFPDWVADAPVHADTNEMDIADADAAEAAALAALAEEEAGQDAAGLTELDEDMLRDIVREIIREELQGSLGERITRNVRKLVRAEINRALITQDLE
ncbi:MAG: hypothetical protein ACRCS3_13800 [Paracoccaceae bacterium]